MIEIRLLASAVLTEEVLDLMLSVVCNVKSVRIMHDVGATR